ncbi:RsmE family RNA methyltransferase [Limosilactobacillus frumenti]|uniref:RsmE family RNA methyltransferase n=1 Tax=Limosilactobacillus frumenti TaxID=104955 RepID=UPI00070DDE34|nr:16S rRNA (uracil(1498)-N(3))-methyltransferase [Limosilactobacillus frumenti]QFG72492.1 16S rRNA (uracil(1498)-N(3))-methyltransferase [Limosilactobacillus frumenti]
MQHYFVNRAVPNQRFTLPDDISHHLVTVLRAQIGTRFELVFNDHQCYLAELTSTAPTVSATIIHALGRNPELPVHTGIACGIPKTKEKPEMIVQKGTEVGVQQIIFFDAERSISHWQGNKRARKLARLQKIANSAAEQSHRNVQPQIYYCDSLKELLNSYPATHRLVAWEESAKQGETSALVKVLRQTTIGESLLAIFGPEGGLSSEEVATMESQGVIPVGLGPRILRTETAPLYFLSAVSVITELVSSDKK